jgi:osmotically-inducible protein OsmY
MSDKHPVQDASPWNRTSDDRKPADTTDPLAYPEGSGKGVEASARPVSVSRETESKIEQALRATAYAPLRTLQVRVAEGLAILRGPVPSYYLKQVAQAVALGVTGISDVHNELDVVPQEK